LLHPVVAAGGLVLINCLGVPDRCPDLRTFVVVSAIDDVQGPPAKAVP
jgi:hypothetical protein